MKKRALGIFIDDYQLKTALLVSDNHTIQVEALETFNLYEQLEERESLEKEKETKSRSNDEGAFGLDLDNATTPVKDKKLEDGKSNIDVIIDLINKMIPKGAKVGFNLSNSNTLYKNITEISEKNRKKIKQSIWNDFYSGSDNDTKFENVGYLKRTNGTLLSVVHDDPLVLGALFDEACTMTHTNLVQLSLIDTIEFTIAHDITKIYQMEKDEHSAVIIFAEGFTKIFFLKGNEIEAVLPTIHEGVDSETVCDTTFSKILFELDSGNISSLNNIVLVGEIGRLDADEYFKNRLPELKVIRYNAPRAANGELMEKYASQMEGFGVAIALALKILDDKDSTFYNQNFLPTRIKDKTSIYKVNWHGLLLLVFLFISAFFVTTKSISNHVAINKATIQSKYLDSELINLKSVAHQVDSLRAEINELKKSTALIDSMTKQTIRWAPTLEALSKAYIQIGPFSVTHIETPSTDHLIAEMKMKDRAQVAKLERFMDFSLISAVNTSIEDKNYIDVKIECKVNLASENLDGY